MSRAAVCIGVNSPGLLALAPLKASASGAQEFAEWLCAKQGFEKDDVKCLTDAKPTAAVTLADVKAAIKELVDSGPEQLIVYFSGHGILNGQSEIWLLSNGDAVDLTVSREVARFNPVLNVVFISDACRALPTNALQSLVSGGSIFTPPAIATGKEAETDVFYAAPRAGVALEVPTDETKKTYKNLFTDLLMRSYRDPPLEITTTLPGENGQAPRIVVPNRKLRPVLVQRVLAEAERLFPGKAPSPTLRLESGDSGYVGLAEFTAPDGSTSPTPPKPRPKPPSGLPEIVLDLPAQFRLQARMRINSNESAFKDIFSTVNSFDDETGSFETLSGIELQGASAKAILSTSGEIQAAAPGSRGRLRWRFVGSEAASPPSIGIAFEGGTGAIVTCLPGYVTAITVMNGDVANVSFIPARNGQVWPRYAPRARAVNDLRARVAAAARLGTLTLEPEDAEGFDNEIRIENEFDPTLGLYAAYAYAELGYRKRIEAVRDFMLRDIDVDLYDVALLTGRRDPRAQTSKPIAPFCPMLSQGWSYAQAYNVKWHAVLQQAKRRSSLWTTFDTESTARILKAIKGRELR